MRGLNKFVGYVKSLIFPFVPIGLLELRDYKREKSSNYFYGGYKEYLSSTSLNSVDSLLTRNYKQVVDVIGFGYSGSGAVIDLFAECDNVNTIGYSEENTYDKVDVTIGYETDFVRLSGGLFEIEKYLDSNNFFHNDALLNRFIKCVENFPPFKECKEIRNSFFDFFDKIVELKIMDLNWNAYNPYLYPFKKKSNIFFLKKMSLADYHKLVSELLIKILNILNREKNSDFLVFDHIFGDGEMDAAKNEKYINGCKTIIVYRDPRDVYAFAKKTDMAWIAHNSVDDFIAWYKIMVRNLNLNDQKQLIVQFEKLVVDYESEIKRIFDFVGLNPIFHNQDKKFKHFNPKFSIGNVGIWRNSMIPNSEFDMIYKSLKPYCYYEL